MSVERWGFESGNNGDALNAANSGSDTVLNTGGTAVISTVQAMHGTCSALFTSTSTSGVLYCAKTISTTTRLGLDAYIYFTALPGSTEAVILWIGAGATRQVSLCVASTGALRIRDGGGGGGTNIWTSSSTIPLNTWVRISMVSEQDASAGQIRAAYYTGDSTTPVADSGLLTARNTGSTPYSTVRIGGKTSTGTITSTFYLDDWGYDTTAAALLPPSGATAPVLVTPTVANNLAFINMTGTTFAVGPGAYAAMPSTGTIPVSSGILVPRPTDVDSATYTITATDTATGAAASTEVEVIGISNYVRGHSESVVWDGSVWV